MLLSWSLMLSQAMESVTRAFYARADLDLILTSPAPAPRRSRCASARSRSRSCRDGVLLLGALHQRARGRRRRPMARRLWRRHRHGPFGRGRSRSRSRSRCSALIGPRAPGSSRRSSPPSSARLSSSHCRSRRSCPTARCRARVADSRMPVQPIARASTACCGGRRARRSAITALVARGGSSLALLAPRCSIFSPRFADHAVAAAGVSAAVRRQTLRRRRIPPRLAPARAARKEWTLLRRDPWLVSQTLMQLLYLLPPALLLWHSFSASDGALIVLVTPVWSWRRAARRRPRLADDLGRGRPRPGRDRADPAAQRHARQDRGGARRPRSSRR